jgi:SAM-dependent methyltransferase
MQPRSLSLPSVPIPDYHDWHEVRVASCLAHLESHLVKLGMNGATCLDLGHDPKMGAKLTSLGLMVTGNVHPSQATPDVPWTLAPFDFETGFPFPDGSFDIVTAFEVIEHVIGSPRVFLDEAFRVLRPGGLLYLGTPNVVSWAKVRRMLSYYHPYDAMPYSLTFGPRHPMCHVYEYDPWTLKQLVGSSGFDVVDCRTWDAYASDPRGVRNAALRVLVSASLLITGFIKDAALIWRHRGHQIGLVARRK